MNTSRAIAALTIALLTSVPLAQAQTVTTSPPPELRKLDYFAGTWSTRTQLLAPSGAVALTLTGFDRVRWVLGGFFLAIDSQQSSPRATAASTTYIGYNTLSKVYIIDLFTDRGIAEHALGTFDGTTWTWISVEKHVRITMHITSPSSYDYTVELLPPGASSFVTVSQSKRTRVSPSQ